MIWPALRAVVDGVIWTLEAAGSVYDAGAKLVAKVRGKKPAPEPPHPTWLDVKRQQDQAAAAAHAFPPKPKQPPTK